MEVLRRLTRLINCYPCKQIYIKQIVTVINEGLVATFLSVETPFFVG